MPQLRRCLLFLGRRGVAQLFPLVQLPPVLEPHRHHPLGQSRHLYQLFLLFVVGKCVDQVAGLEDLGLLLLYDGPVALVVFHGCGRFDGGGGVAKNYFFVTMGGRKIMVVATLTQTQLAVLKAVVSREISKTVV